MYLASGGAVFLAYLCTWAYPALALGRLANLIVFALLAAFAVKAAPCGQSASLLRRPLLPMTLHLAASFSRDAVLLGAVLSALRPYCWMPSTASPRRNAWPALAVAGILLAPGKMVYLPPWPRCLCWSPRRRAGPPRQSEKSWATWPPAWRWLLVLNTGTLTGALGSPAADNAAAVTEETTDDARSAKNLPR